MGTHTRSVGYLAAASVAWLLAGNCDPLPPNDPTEADAGATLEHQCWHACEHLRHLGCPGFDGQPSASATCEQTCVQVERSGVARFCPVELVYARNCAELEQQWEACE